MMRYSLKTILKHLYMFDNYVDVLDMYSQYIHTDIFIKNKRYRQIFLKHAIIVSFLFCCQYCPLLASRL